MRLLKASQFLRMPWKNGGGVTHEIARFGEGDDFLWRLSITIDCARENGLKLPGILG
jgi:uncharacterized protein